MESNLNILLRKIPVIYQSGKQEKGGTVILYAINNFMKQKIEKKLKNTDIPHKVEIVDSTVQERYHQCPNTQLPKQPFEQQIPKPLPTLTCKLYDATMTKDNFIVHSGNQKAYKSLMYSIKNTAQNQSPICLIGQPGSGKTSLLSHILIQGESRGFCPGYINIQRLKYRDISANKGAKGLSFEYFTKSNLTAIDNVEEVPTSNKSTWIRNLIYGFAEQGLTANSLQLFSFTGDRTQYVNFLNNIPLVSLKDKWKLAEVIELDYPEDSEHKLFIKKSIENSGVVPTKPEELEKIVSHIDSAIPKNYPISVRGIQEYLTQAINPAKRMGVMTPGGVTASLSYQTTIYNPDTKNPVAIFDKIMQETGYDTDIITKKGRREEVISMKKNVIKLLWEGGIKSSSEIARLMKVTPSTISNHFKKMDIK